MLFKMFKSVFEIDEFISKTFFFKLKKRVELEFCMDYMKFLK